MNANCKVRFMTGKDAKKISAELTVGTISESGILFFLELPLGPPIAILPGRTITRRIFQALDHHYKLLGGAHEGLDSIQGGIRDASDIEVARESEEALGQGGEEEGSEDLDPSS